MYMLEYSKDVPYFNSLGSNPASFLIFIHKVAVNTVFATVSIVAL